MSVINLKAENASAIRQYHSYRRKATLLVSFASKAPWVSTSFFELKRDLVNENSKFAHPNASENAARGADALDPPTFPTIFKN